ncbi:hypothetical protein E1B28_008714 [Marasmius oreades]|uniref:Uncharacterized protein n=1 Tax=Marasmius oreades TaxID=181124 RepID=A0A9P7RZ19_9AGAR|nr:uncharacterized protein E1B28_008714 [Marasmius oreades]KAG7092354.1 hypothetical protein E1B28_008714 [Marasmius oreades]
MRSPFIIIRFIFFCLLLYLNLLTLVFAVLNVSSASSAGLSVPGTQVLLIFTNCLTLLLLALGLLPMIWSKSAFANLTLECMWTLVLSLLQMGAAIGSAASISLMIREPTDPSVAVSSVLLLPTSWLLSVLQLAYFFTILITAMIHARHEPEVWRSSIYTIKWFGFSNVKIKTTDISGPRPKSGYENDSWTLYLEDIESTAARKARHTLSPSEKPAWAPISQRRGVDPPFMRRDKTPRSSVSTEHVTPPLKAEVKGGSRFIERICDLTITRPPNNPTSFPSEVEDHDKPIPIPRISKWMSAEALKGFGVGH